MNTLQKKAAWNNMPVQTRKDIIDLYRAYWVSVKTRMCLEKIYGIDNLTSDPEQEKAPSFAKQLEMLCDTQIDEIKAGKDIVAFAVAYDESYFTFRAIGDRAGMAVGLSRALRNWSFLKELVHIALDLAKCPQADLDRLFADNIHLNEIMNLHTSTQK